MNTKFSNAQLAERDFYKTVNERKDEVQDILNYLVSPEHHGFLDFEAWYTQEYDWRFLRDILGGQQKHGLPWDYNRLIHKPTINGNTLTDYLTSGDLDLVGFDNIEAGTGITVTQTTPNDSTTDTIVISNNLTINTGTVPSTAVEATYLSYDGTDYKISGGGSTPTNMVTTNTDQDISGEKTFTNTSGIIVSNASTGKSTNFTANQININDGTTSVAISYPTTTGKLALTTDIPTVDTALSVTSTNPVQNKVITNALDYKANSADLSTVATSGDYDDLTNKPTIPTKTSELTNDSNFIDKDVDNLTNYTTTTDLNTALAAKQDLITTTNKLDYSLIDNTPTIDSSIDTTSTNAVENQAIGKAVATLTGKVTIKAVLVEPTTPYTANMLYYISASTTEYKTPYRVWLTTSTTDYIDLGTSDVDLSGYAKLDGTQTFTGSDTFSNMIYVGKMGYSDTLVTKEGPSITYPTDATGKLKSGTFALTSDLDSKVSITGDTMTGDLTIEKDTPEIYLDNTASGTTKLSGITFQQDGTEKRNILYDATNDKLYINSQDSSGNEQQLVVPKVAGTIATLDDIGGMVSTTYDNLVTLRTNSKLVAGTWYRITDYVATTTQTNTQATTNQYDIIVLATSTNTLSEDARAIQHSGDTYFANSNLNDWKLKYSLTNDTTRFAWADSTNGKGVVYWLQDEFDNQVWYDFKCIQVKNTNKSDRFYYLFDNSGVDASLNTSTTIACYSNHFGNYVTSDKYNIGCNICYGGNNFYSNTIGNYFRSNTIGNNFNYNTIGNAFYFNTIGNKFYSNTIGDAFYSNTIGNSFYFNTIGNKFYSNTIGDAFYSNTIGNSFYFNTIGSSFYSNTIGNYFYSNTIGNDFNSNTIGNKFNSNNTTSISTQPQYCVFPNNVNTKITTSTTTWTNSRTYYLGSDGTLKSLS